MNARTICVLATAGTAAGLSACASMPKTQAGDYANRGGAAAGSAAADTYSGLGDAAKAPLRDFNIVRDQIPPILVRAYARPYDQTGLDTCPAIEEQVRQLDLALGPDVDIPQAATPEQDMFAKGATFAADAALDAVRSATTGVIPVRSWVRRISGANRMEQQAKSVALAGSVRRGYLKAIGQAKGCDWPASPLSPQTTTEVRQGPVAAPSPVVPSATPVALQTAAQATPISNTGPNATLKPQH